MEQKKEKKRFQNIKEIGRVVKNCMIGTKTRDENGNIVITKEALTWKGTVVAQKPDGTFVETECASGKRLLIGCLEVVGLVTVGVISAGVVDSKLNSDGSELPAIEDGANDEETPIE